MARMNGYIGTIWRYIRFDGSKAVAVRRGKINQDGSVILRQLAECPGGRHPAKVVPGRHAA